MIKLIQQLYIMASQHNSLVLKKSNEARFNQIYGSFAKSEPNALRLSEFMNFIFDRCLVSNKITLKDYYQLFCRSTQKRTLKQMAQNSPTNLMQKVILKEELVYLLNELGKKIYHNDKNYHDKIYNDLLGEKTVAEKGLMHFSRSMITDEINRKMCMQNAVRTLSNFQNQLKSIYLIYVEENYWSLQRNNRLLLTHREIQLQNKRMSALSFMRFLKEAEILPHLINVENVEDILNRVVPPVNPKQSEFYYKHYLVECYSKDLDNSQLHHEGDPGLLLFEFMIVLARISVEISKQVENTKKVYDYVINKFFSGYLGIRTNQQLEQGSQLPNLNKPYLKNLKKYYKYMLDESNQEGSDEYEEEENLGEKLKLKQQALYGLKPLELNLKTILKTLDSQLPPTPSDLVVKQENPPPYPPKFKEVQKIVLGQQLPVEKQDKKGPSKPPQKKNTLKKGEKPPRIFQYLNKEDQTKPVLSSEDYFQKLATDLDYSLKPLSSLERGNIPLDPFPYLISQILYPSEIPEQVLPYIEAAINSHNEDKFVLSIENYQLAHETWAKALKVLELPATLEMYFEFSRGSVYLSAGKDDYALQSFFNCRNHGEKIPYLNPDRAISYCGIGEVLYHAQEYDLALRSYLKARQIREALLGVEAVDTATVYNNLGCCFFMVGRNKEALSYLKIANAVLTSQLGQFHERSQTSKENINTVNKSFYVNIPEYRKLWQVYEKDPFGKKKKKKKKDGKGK